MNTDNQTEKREVVKEDRKARLTLHSNSNITEWTRMNMYRQRLTGVMETTYLSESSTVLIRIDTCYGTEE